ncbi:MAG: FtsX-like permease family protein [Deltaproteobacteria bacterium]|nr:FtsX-like permease family protein [Deltaproteobacteria bacterium]
MFIAYSFALTQLTLTVYTLTLTQSASLIPASTITVVAYLEKDLTEVSIRKIQERLAVIEAISSVKFVPGRSGLERMRQWLGEDNPLIKGLDPKVLPDAFEIILKQAYMHEAEKLVTEISGLSGIDEVRYNKGLFAHIADSYQKIRVVGTMVVLLLILTLGLLIYFSIRLSIVRHTQEIETLQLIGADDFFLVGPYIVESCMYGILGSVLALVITGKLIDYLHANVPVFFSVLAPLTSQVMFLVVVFAFCISVAGAVFAIRTCRDA